MSYYINRTNNGNYSTNYIGSPKFLYNLCKISDCASGSYYPRALAILKDKGICTWSDMPYNDYECTQIPNSSQYASASRYKIRSWSYLSITQTDKIKRLVYSGYPIMIAIKAYTNLFSYKSGLYNTMTGSNHGGHAVVITGYDDYLQAYKIQNSWGNNWGNNGFMWVGYNFLAQQLTLEPRCYLIVPDF
jgi:C1A family cysteine protease